MQKKIRYVVVLGTISLIGLIIAQAYWLKQAFDIQEKKIDQSILVALINVANDMASFSKIDAPNPNPVVQLASDYFVVNINDKIDANVLEHYLILEFKKNGINLDFDYGIYDCYSDQIVYGNYLSFKDSKKKNLIGVDLPKYEDYIYYFGIRFPGKINFIAGNIKYWLFSSLILIIVILFFSVTLFIILRQKRISEIQKNFINNMTHEFKTPISTIKVSTEVLSNVNIINNPKRLRKYVDIIIKENERLHQQVETILRMADIEMETNQINIRTIDIHETILEIAKQMELRVFDEHGGFNYKLEATNSIISADELHLKNLISNLLDNAIKYSPNLINISIATENQNNQLVISITDLGIGISKEHQKYIFDKFYRVPKGNIHDVKGFGLGLNYVLNVVKNHNWKIEVKSEIGKGTIISVIVPQ